MLGRARSESMLERGTQSRTLWALNGLPPATVFDVEDWLDSLAELPLDGWLRIAERCAVSDQSSLPATRACQRIERLITDNGLEFTAWVVRDLVETATFPVRQAAGERPRIVRARLSVARMAAEWAALAKMCRPWLAPADHDLLCGLFAEPAPRHEPAAG